MTFEPTRPISADPITPASAASEPAAPPAAAPLAPPEPAMAPPPAAPPSPTRRSGSGRWLNVVLGVAVVVAIGGVAFAVGRGTAPASAATGNGRGGLVLNGGGFPTGSFTPGGNGGQVFRGGFGGAPTINGTVESVDGDKITIKTADGQTITLTTDSDTTYHTQAPASAADVTPGSTVKVQLDLDGNAVAGGPRASGAPGAALGTAGSVTVVP